MPAGELVSTDRSPDADPLRDPFRPVHVTSPLTPHDMDRLERVIRYADRTSGLRFSVYVGPLTDEPRAYAVSQHQTLDDPDHAVLIAVDPSAHALEIITGSATRRTLGDAECRLAAATMQTNFAAHDLAGGLTAGIQQLATAAYEAPTLHVTRGPAESA